jgi:hypothetical protein
LNQAVIAFSINSELQREETCKTYLPSILQLSDEAIPLGRHPVPIDLKSEYRASWKIILSILFGDACDAIALTIEKGNISV